MVPGPRARESRSPLDSRTPRGNPRGVLSFYAARLYCWTGLRLRLALAPTAGQYRPPAAHGPSRRTASGAFSFLRRPRLRESRGRSWDHAAVPDLCVMPDIVPAYMILSCPKNFFKALLLRECSILQILKCDKEFVLSLNRYFVCTNFVRFYSVFGDFLHVFWKKNFLYIIFWKKISFFFNIFVFLQKNDVNLNLRVWNN